ncbi:hypothetical protein DK842_04585 [Chromobacterium phragmitis]|uniref:TonB C-terminal domain-containing protein n=1 Tax=Chromobacterium phragmitis TaxID=2202141 RepID=A0A344UH64_9NEIS|nr:TonB family protein [Chromobacterium phragmitis]AXE29253.1 hypothetical protein DK842_04585 [Chromobacterium phragmitis]AXE34612.1 hypothetical protein DK843_10050 [Chromobacterium phragmitis]
MLSASTPRLRWAVLLSIAIHGSILAVLLAVGGEAPLRDANLGAMTLVLPPPGLASRQVAEGPAHHAPSMARGAQAIEAQAKPTAKAGAGWAASDENKQAGRLADAEHRRGIAAAVGAAGANGPEMAARALAGRGEAARSGVAEASGGSEALYAPAYLNNPQPAYPERSRQLGEEGTVLLKVRVSADGRALAVSIARSSGYRRLDRSAAETVSNWRFVPAKRNGDVVESDLTVPVRFAGSGH